MSDAFGRAGCNEFKKITINFQLTFLGYIILCNLVVTATGLLSGIRISFDDHSAH